MGRKFTIFALFYFVFEGKFQVQAPQGAYIRRGDLTEGFLRYDFGGLIFGGAFTWRGLFMDNTQWYTSHPRVMVTNVTLNDRILVTWVPFLKIAPMINGPCKLSLFTLNIGVSIVLHLK